MSKSKYSLYIATPAYGSQTVVPYTKSMWDLAKDLGYKKIPSELYLSMGEAFITRARNMHAQSFLESDHTHLLFIDADEGFPVQLIHDLLKASEKFDVVGGLYPTKALNWRKLIETGELMGLLSRFFTPVPGSEPDADGFQPALRIPTGMMLINRHVLENLVKENPNDFYYDAVPNRNADDPLLRKTYNFFQGSVFDDEEGRPTLFGEDYTFCQKVIDAGMTIGADISWRVTHQGPFEFGNFFL